MQEGWCVINLTKLNIHYKLQVPTTPFKFSSI